MKDFFGFLLEDFLEDYICCMVKYWSFHKILNRKGRGRNWLGCIINEGTEKKKKRKGGSYKNAFFFWFSRQFGCQEQAVAAAVVLKEIQRFFIAAFLVLLGFDLWFLPSPSHPQPNPSTHPPTHHPWDYYQSLEEEIDCHLGGFFLWWVFSRISWKCVCFFKVCEVYPSLRIL